MEVNLHAELYSDVSANDVEPGSPGGFEGEAHHINNVDQEERKAEDNGGQDLDFERACKVQTRRNDGGGPDQDDEATAIQNDARFGRLSCLEGRGIAGVRIDASSNDENKRDD